MCHQNPHICFLCFLRRGRRSAWRTLATLFLQHTTKVTCYITATPLNFSLFVPSVTEYPSLSGPDNGHLSYTEGNNTLNSSCQQTCYLGFLTIGSLPCRVTGAWNGTRAACESNVMGGGGSPKSHQEWFEYLAIFSIHCHDHDITVWQGIRFNVSFSAYFSL